MEKQINETAARDAAIVSEFAVIGDAKRLAQKFGVKVMHVYRLLHENELAKEVAKANIYAQAAMKAGEVVFALPAKTLQTSVGADAIINALESAIKNAGDDLGVYIAIAVIPIDQIEGTLPAEPLMNARTAATTLQAKAVNATRKAEVLA